MKRIWIAVGLVAIAVAVAVALPWFLPKNEVMLDQSLPPGADEDAELVWHRAAIWTDGDGSHRASGNLDIVTVDGDLYARFRNFSMTAGPDVYLYFTEETNPRTTAEVEGGLRIPVRTDADPDPRLNERGTFFVPLDLDLAELASYDGIAAWCDNFNVLFANGRLSQQVN